MLNNMLVLLFFIVILNLFVILTIRSIEKQLHEPDMGIRILAGIITLVQIALFASLVIVYFDPDPAYLAGMGEFILSIGTLIFQVFVLILLLVKSAKLSNKENI